MAKIVSTTDLAGLVGTAPEISEWLEITQERVNDFADATNDHQFIHVDPDRAALTPFGGPIAHGYLTMSLLTHFLDEVGVRPEGLVMVVNYGSDKVRYLTPVRIGKRIRTHVVVLDVNEKKPGQWLVKNKVTVEIEGMDSPAMIAELLTLFFVE